MSREILTISHMNTLMTCPRKAYYMYEMGLKPDIDAEVLRFGSAFHAGMQARWSGLAVGEAFDAALNTAKDMDEQTMAVVSGLLAGYYDHYGPVESVEGSIIPEIEFRHPINGSLTFDAAGKIDCLIDKGSSVMLVEHKTTGEDISDGSSYWNRLKMNNQLFQYYLGAKQMGYNIETVVYDVIHKPAIRPKTAVPVLDEAGLKIVVDSAGQRVMKKNNEPKQSADAGKGESVKTCAETLEAFSERLLQDCKERPEFYFARREVPILVQDLEAFVDQRLEIGKQILHYRARERKVGIAGWPRNVQYWTCGAMKCPYEGFCLQGMDVDPTNPPVGMTIRKGHDELDNVGENNAEK